MENIKILAENIIHIDEVKEEPMDHIEESTLNSIVKQEPDDHAVDHVGNFTEGGELRSLKREVKQEDEEEEVKPPVRVFLSPHEESSDEFEQQHEDPFASCNENVHGVGASAVGVGGKANWEKRRLLLRDALGSQQTCVGNGAPTQSVKQWKSQKHLRVLQPQVANKTREGNLNEGTDDRVTPPQNCGIDDSTEVVERRSNRQQEFRSAVDEAVFQAPPEIPFPTQALIPSPSAIDSKSTKTKKKETVAGLIKRHLEQHEERRKSRSEETKRMFEQMSAPSDSLYHFFLSMYGITKNMPPTLQFAVRKNVLRVVTNTEASLLNIPADHSPKTSQPNTDQGTSQHSKRTSRQSWTRSSTRASSGHYDNTMSYTSQTSEKNVEIEPNTSTTG